MWATPSTTGVHVSAGNVAYPMLGVPVTQILGLCHAGVSDSIATSGCKATMSIMKFKPSNCRSVRYPNQKRVPYRFPVCYYPCYQKRLLTSFNAVVEIGGYQVDTAAEQTAESRRYFYRLRQNRRGRIVAQGYAKS